MANKCAIDVRLFPPLPELEGCFAIFFRAEFHVSDGGRVRDHLQPEWANIRFFSGDTPDARLPGGLVLGGARFTATGPSSLPTEFGLGQVCPHPRWRNGQRAFMAERARIWGSAAQTLDKPRR